jgi:hypothetical protein
VARVIIKAVLGWSSFISMAAARRHQAVHDLLTRSTVQFRDPIKALPHHYGRERVELSSPDMPSRTLRILVIAGHLVLICAVWWWAAALLKDILCLNEPPANCVGRDTFWQYVVGLIAIWRIARTIGLGWRGQLWGARRRVESACARSRWESCPLAFEET